MRIFCIFSIALLFSFSVHSQPTQKPVLHAKHWLAITGKPLGATAGASIFNQGGNAIDASCAMRAGSSSTISRVNCEIRSFKRC